ncbi:MAG TPA: CPXCG motif-containing cysteine-rich protein [Spongiibacteraceae bacterium]|nr:CPXCG motif-containing cysteine-rich protein [Spongiibacteraceae bacterium]
MNLESVSQQCPYCGETIELLIDCSEPEQRYIEDCEVCCRPIDIAVIIDSEGFPDVTLSTENDA